MMRNSALLLFVLMVVLAACSPAPQIIYVTVAPSQTPAVIVVTATPEPSKTPSPTLVPSATPQSTPTLEVLNPHAECLRRNGVSVACDVLPNGEFDPPYSAQFITGRQVQEPADWDYVFNPQVKGVPADKLSGVSPNITCSAGTCRMDFDSRNGLFGYVTDGDPDIPIYRNQRYLLKLVYDFNCVPKEQQLNPLDFNVQAGIWNSSLEDAVRTELIAKPVDNLQGMNEALWLIQSPRQYSSIVVNVNFQVTHAVCGQYSYITVKDVNLFPVPQSFGSMNEVTGF